MRVSYKFTQNRKIVVIIIILTKMYTPDGDGQGYKKGASCIVETDEAKAENICREVSKRRDGQ